MTSINFNLSLRLKGLALIDGILCNIISEKDYKDLNVLKVNIIGKLKTSFVVHKNGEFSHGKTLKKAIEDLRYKVSNRDTSEFTSWKNNLNKEVSLNEAIAAYRTITGACEQGVRDFVESVNLPNKITPKKIIKLTKNKYGHAMFVRFLNN
jgi:hypothetical protein